jgi:hypothetical protein
MALIVDLNITLIVDLNITLIVDLNITLIVDLNITLIVDLKIANAKIIVCNKLYICFYGERHGRYALSGI